jgi:hypothetical protein
MPGPSFPSFPCAPGHGRRSSRADAGILASNGGFGEENRFLKMVLQGFTGSLSEGSRLGGSIDASWQNSYTVITDQAPRRQPPPARLNFAPPATTSTAPQSSRGRKPGHNRRADRRYSHEHEQK